jgi:hypothetical protein
MIAVALAIASQTGSSRDQRSRRPGWQGIQLHEYSQKHERPGTLRALSFSLSGAWESNGRFARFDGALEI